MSEAAPVLVSVEGSIGRLTLNRPKALHALDTEMCRIMAGALKDWADDDSILAVLVDHANGTRGFCAGGDIVMLKKSGASDGAEAREFFAEEYRLNTLIKNFNKPYIALMDGVTMGGGVGISVHGMFRVATENTVFSMPETGIGLFPDVGGGWFLPRLEGELGMWLALTGARLKGSDVADAGVATHHIPANELDGLVKEITSADLSGDAAHEVEKILAAHHHAHEPASYLPHMETINTCFSKGSVEEIVAALEEDGGEWAAKQLKVMATKSPLTMKISFRQLREGAEFSTFEDNMRNEYRIGARQVMSADFQEGVRAVIIDKDNNPVWPSESLEKVTAKMLDDIFAPLGENELSFT